MSLNDLALKIEVELKQIEKEFSEFQKSMELACKTQCAACCQNPEISCHPFELLPLALDLYNRGLALDYLNSLENNSEKICSLLSITDEKNGLGYCTNYSHRPSLCRAFGVAGRKNKLDQVELSLCKKLKEMYPSAVLKNEIEVPLIGLLKFRLESIDPVFLDQSYPINQSLKIILEKVLLYKKLEKSN